MKTQNRDTVNIPLDTLIELTLEKYYEDIETVVKYFVYKTGVPNEIQEDLVQEAVVLIMENLHKYDYTKSALRTYIINQTQIACLRYRTQFFKMRTSKWEVDFEELPMVQYKSQEEIFTEHEMDEEEMKVLSSRVDGYTFKEIEDMYNISSRRVYNIINKFKDSLEREGLDN